jgi:hypothetical protein
MAGSNPFPEKKAYNHIVLKLPSSLPVTPASKAIKYSSSTWHMIACRTLRVSSISAQWLMVWLYTRDLEYLSSLPLFLLKVLASPQIFHMLDFRFQSIPNSQFISTTMTRIPNGEELLCAPLLSHCCIWNASETLNSKRIPR